MRGGNSFRLTHLRGGPSTWGRPKALVQRYAGECRVHEYGWSNPSLLCVSSQFGVIWINNSVENSDHFTQCFYSSFSKTVPLKVIRTDFCISIKKKLSFDKSVVHPAHLNSLPLLGSSGYFCWVSLNPPSPGPLQKHLCFCFHEFCPPGSVDEQHQLCRTLGPCTLSHCARTVPGYPPLPDFWPCWTWSPPSSVTLPSDALVSGKVSEALRIEDRWRCLKEQVRPCLRSENKRVMSVKPCLSSS